MRLIHRVADLRAALAGQHHTAFVPTMGNLHSGHISLIELARRTGPPTAGPIVASIFVNPLQFGAGEDFNRYPRTLDADCAQLAAAGCDIVFAPDAAEMYPEPQTFSVQPPLADELCGQFRPGHFQGVATVVLKLFNMVQPRYAAFGKKDYQQLFILKAMVRQLNLPIVMLEGETGRAEDGLALSSRNGYLSAEERAEAPRLYRLLRVAAQQVASGVIDLADIEAGVADELTRHGWRVDYIAPRSRSTLLAPTPEERDLVLLAAAHLGRTRLIDNIECRRQALKVP
jgi:pantoate--beta-alanine ligase